METMTDSAPPSLPPATGAILAGRYRLTTRIGRGGMADVFRAEDDVLHRAVAVKVFRFDAAAGEDRRRVDAEMRLLAALRHPGLVTVFDAGAAEEPNGETTPFLVMELITGPTLGQRLSEGPLPPEQAAALGAELATTLAYVHAAGVVHRDLKPANVLLDGPIGATGFTAKLTDFGIARLVDSTRLTADGMTVGTANYLSPEQAETGVATPASDVYSLGLVLLECLTGRLAYPGVGVEAALARLRRAPHVPTEYGPLWTRLLTAMTDRDPEKRPGPAAISRKLRQLAGGSAVESRPLGEPWTHPTVRITPQQTAAAGSTAVLSLTGRTAQPATRASRSPRRAASRTAKRVAERLRRWSPRAYLGAAAALVVLTLAAAIVVALSTTGSGGSPGPRPAYPAVTGPLGTHLQQLEGAVP
jgi:eukaryotic-like serine/threonine-protein kinase